MFQRKQTQGSYKEPQKTFSFDDNDKESVNYNS